MLYSVSEFTQYISQDINGFIEELQDNTIRMFSDIELKAMAESYTCVSHMLALASKKNPSFGTAQILTTNMLLEYKLPAASSWCDLVLIGKKKDKKQVIIIELKNWLKNNDDKPGLTEGLICHKGEQHLHPAEQVRGYTEYCRRFHSTVLDENANVDGCVYFTQEIDLTPLRLGPNASLTTDFPLFNAENASTSELSEYVLDRIDSGDDGFAVRFNNGFYKQDRNILKQVAANLSKATESNAKPFVLLDAQRRGFQLVMGALEECIQKGSKQVIIVEGPPGSGKSAVAANLWIEAVNKYGNNEKAGNIVYVTTSSSQKDNWMEVFETYGGRYGAKGFIYPANSFNPGMTGATMKETYLPIFRKMNRDKYVNPDNPNSLRFEHFRDYTNYMVTKKMTQNYKENLHFLSIVDEAHALINPVSDGFKTNKTAGWCFQMGPQAYHIIRESKISVFLTDGKQSFRDNESTSTNDIESFAKEMGAAITHISLSGMQFRCAGSKEYVDWVDALFTNEPIRNAEKWNKHFAASIVDYPSEMENYLRTKMSEGETKSARILSSYTQKWISGATLNAKHTQAEENPDFVLRDKNGKLWRKYWNNPERYNVFIQASKGSAMHEDPLCEVGCPYVVRGFDYDHIGLLWLDDIIWRNGQWMINFENAQETATGSTRKKAKDEQALLNKTLPKGKRKSKEEMNIVPALDPKTPATCELFSTIAQAYRILLTRGIKSICIYIKDMETRNHVRSLLT